MRNFREDAGVPERMNSGEFLEEVRRVSGHDWRVIYEDFSHEIYLYLYAGVENKSTSTHAFMCAVDSMDPERAGDFFRRLGELIGAKMTESSPDQVQTIKIPMSRTRPDGMGLSRAEHEALSKLGEVAELFALEIIALGPACVRDRDEAALHIHTLQRMIMAQAAARAHPDLYRLLGRHGDWLSAR